MIRCMVIFAVIMRNAIGTVAKGQIAARVMKITTGINHITDDQQIRFVGDVQQD